jgi:hypothetical protein
MAGGAAHGIRGLSVDKTPDGTFNTTNYTTDTVYRSRNMFKAYSARFRGLTHLFG